LSEEKIQLKETMGSKISDLKSSITKKDKRIASIEAELQQRKTEFEAEIKKVRQASFKIVVDLSTTKLRIYDLKDEVNHVRQLNENYKILAANGYTLGNICYNELLKGLLLCRSFV
jgi:septal ring factor EnvC (AmiA/AmiB activator)